ncbi:MAG: DUF2808 domain-containing protein [Prochlorococcaceae cyanobacterium]
MIRTPLLSWLDYGLRCALGISAASALALVPAPALELRGRTYFSSPPLKLTFRNYYSNAWEAGGEYYFTLLVPPAAGASLGGLRIQQSHGVDWSFPFLVERSRAFLGEPRREGRSLPLEVSFEAQARLFMIRFLEPVAPGQTVTVALRPQRNPGQADTYLFAVTAFPDGPQPEGAPLGFARMPIYDPRPF